MQYISYYHSPLGKILLASDHIGITGLWFENQKYYAYKLNKEHKEIDSTFFDHVKHWLDIYFSGKEPDFLPPIHLIGTSFQIEVWEILKQIPYGETTIYGEIAIQIAQKKELSQMSSQAVGGAVGHPISIMIPCHRVIGKNGSLTGYAGGIDKKIELLSLEKVPIQSFFIPKKGSAL
ncbi:methylated-DNA--[protein]-cysteine S-methyltransferase [Clostridioides difficile]|nr:methylated-DNA--[protein]-cysteine S-methyltransferase [Clostridioides difficile]